LVTTRVVAGGVQKLGYVLSARGHDGVYVVGASQQLPVGYRAPVQAGSPDANLNFALYFGSSPTAGALIETSAGHLPLTGTVSKATVPFGNNVLTLVASPRGSLSGTWAEYLPWGILGLGILLSVVAAGATESLVRRRTTAEASYRQQRRMSETLQRSLLPKRLPSVDLWDFAARYVSATKGAEIGGDWYSVVEVDDHRFAVVVGDVSGHDMAAAGIMAALRYTIRALAKLGTPPDEILDRAAQELDITTDNHFATVLVGLVDTRIQEMTLASAGHPPPLMVHDGYAQFVKVAPGVPLGVPGPRAKTTTTHFLPGSTLIAYTDGLIEQRGQTLDTGLQRLAAAAADSPPRPGDLIARLISALTTDDQEDDIAVLAIRFAGEEANPETPTPGRSRASTAGDPPSS
jgi:serine phosphatase RsbU (regulator of sigma subunit)